MAKELHLITVGKALFMVPSSKISEGLSMATYYIDYENVHNGGMRGVENTTNNDLVYVFYSAGCNTMTMDSIKRILSSRCAIEFIETTPTGTANCLDFQLITLLYSNIDGDDYHYIITNDKGFDASILMAKRIGLNCVARFNSIQDATADYEKTKLTKTVNYDEDKVDYPVHGCEVSVSAKDDNTKDTVTLIQELVQKECDIDLPQEKLDITCVGIYKSTTKMELYKYLRKHLGDKQGRLIYGAVSDKWGEITALAS